MGGWETPRWYIPDCVSSAGTPTVPAYAPEAKEVCVVPLTGRSTVSGCHGDRRLRGLAGERLRGQSWLEQRAVVLPHCQRIRPEDLATLRPKLLLLRHL